MEQTLKELAEEYIKEEREVGNKITAKVRQEARTYAERMLKIELTS